VAEWNKEGGGKTKHKMKATRCGPKEVQKKKGLTEPRRGEKGDLQIAVNKKKSKAGKRGRRRQREKFAGE